MSVTVRVPTTLRTLTGGESEVQVEGSTVGAVLDSLEAAHPGFKDRLLDGEGGLRRFVNLYVADDDVRFRDGLTPRWPTATRSRSSPRSPAADRPIWSSAPDHRITGSPDRPGERNERDTDGLPPTHRCPALVRWSVAPTD